MKELTCPYVTLADAAIYLALSRKTLYLWAEKGLVPAHKLGRVWRFRLNELDQFVRSSPSAVYNPAQCNGAMAERSRYDRQANP